ncbi:MAG: hypothetical protein V3W44_09680 [Dehalococcoidales bacterium]
MTRQGIAERYLEVWEQSRALMLPLVNAVDKLRLDLKTTESALILTLLRVAAGLWTLRGATPQGFVALAKEAQEITAKALERMEAKE